MGRRIDNAAWDERRAWIDKQARSGVSAARFCRENGLNLSNFHAWKRKLHGARPAKWRLRGNQTGPTNDRLPSAFVQVPLASRAVSGTPWIEVSLADGMLVRVPAANLPALQMVLSTLTRGQEPTDA